MARQFEILHGRVERVLIGRIHGEVATKLVRKAQFIVGHGVKGDWHAGARLADGREEEFLNFGHFKGIQVANFREFSAVSVEEMQEVASEMKIEKVPEGSVGENLIFSGIPNFTQLPSGTLMFFRKNEKELRTAVLAVWRDNGPCLHAGREIARQVGAKAHDGPPVSGETFPRVAVGKRGIVGSVYASGIIHMGDEVVVYVEKK